MTNDGSWTNDGVSPLKTRTARLTHVLTGAFDPAWTRDGKALLFSAFENGGFQVYKIALPEHPEPTEALVAGVDGPGWRFDRIRQEQVKGKMRYRPRLSLDFAQSLIAQDPEFGTVGGIQLALTDMLGDQQYYFLLSNTADTKNDLLRSFNFALTRLDLTRRVSIAWGLFRFDERYLTNFDARFRERRTGGFVSLIYPFSRFERIETRFLVRTSDRDEFFGNPRDAFLISNFVNYTKDASLWEPTGPLDGERYHLGVGYTVNLRRSDLHHLTLLGDYRRYLRLSRRSAYAFRFLGRWSQGPEPQLFAMGGSWTFRGYSRGSVWGSKLFLVNNELRFPFVDQLLIGLPIGRMGFQAFRGAIFFDLGNAWQDEFGDLLASFGAGVRFSLGGGFVLRLDAARRTDFHRVDPDTRWDFFFGWNY